LPKAGRPAIIRLTPGNVSDVRIADELIEAAGPAHRLIADRGYNATALGALKNQVVRRPSSDPEAEMSIGLGRIPSSGNRN
jgi:hypothetical protein